MSYSTSPTSSTGSYYDGHSRPSTASPTFSQDPMIFKIRYDAGRGFDPDDDYEFCPALTQYPPVANTLSPSVPLPSTPTSVLASPQELVSPVRRPQQIRKALEIINPATGLRVSSPKPKQ